MAKAKKKAAIGDLIKSDMSRRAIGEEPKTAEKMELFLGENSIEKPSDEEPSETKPSAAELPVSETVSVSTNAPIIPEENAGFEAYIIGQARSVGLTNETDLRNFYAFLKDQALRYIRSFDAGRRFHG